MATLARFFSSEIGFELVRGVRVHAEREVTLELDYAALKARADIPDLFAAIEMAPVEGLSCLRAAVHEVVFNSPVGRKELPGLQVHPAAAKVARPPRVDIHLVNHLDARITFDQLRSKNIGRLVSIRGTVVRVGGVKPIVKSLVFVCEKCEFQQTKHLADGKYAEPESCPAPGCRGRKFTADHDSAKCSDWQRVRLQEISDDAGGGARADASSPTLRWRRRWWTSVTRVTWSAFSVWWSYCRWRVGRARCSGRETPRCTRFTSRR